MLLFINHTFISQEMVDELYFFRDRYFETHSVEDAGRKPNDVAQEMAKTLRKLEEKEGEHHVFIIYTHDATVICILCQHNFWLYLVS